MVNFTQAFAWLSRVLEDVRLLESDSLERCVEREKGVLIQGFGLDLLGALLDLSESELIEIHPIHPSPFDFKTRQELKKELNAHLAMCSACVDADLREVARNLETEKAITCAKNHIVQPSTS